MQCIFSIPLYHTSLMCRLRGRLISVPLVGIWDCVSGSDTPFHLWCVDMWQSTCWEGKWGGDGRWCGVGVRWCGVGVRWCKGSMWMVWLWIYFLHFGSPSLSLPPSLSPPSFPPLPSLPLPSFPHSLSSPFPSLPLFFPPSFPPSLPSLPPPSLPSSLPRELAWHDLAFYNADLYEGLRSMLLDAQEGKKSKEEFIATYCCYFEVHSYMYSGTSLTLGTEESVLISEVS